MRFAEAALTKLTRFAEQILAQNEIAGGGQRRKRHFPINTTCFL
jgi:hypothetical protein